jgi:cobalamin biosynthesis protein CobT
MDVVMADLLQWAHAGVLQLCASGRTGIEEIIGLRHRPASQLLDPDLSEEDDDEDDDEDEDDSSKGSHKEKAPEAESAASGSSRGAASTEASTEASNEASNKASKGASKERSKEEEGTKEEAVAQYLVKWVGMSHLQNTYVLTATATRLAASKVYNKIKLLRFRVYLVPRVVRVLRLPTP